MSYEHNETYWTHMLIITIINVTSNQFWNSSQKKAKNIFDETRISLSLSLSLSLYDIQLSSTWQVEFSVLQMNNIVYMINLFSDLFESP